MKNRILPVPKSHSLNGKAAILPMARDIECLGGSLQVTRWRTKGMAFSYLQGQFKSAGPLPHLTEMGSVILLFVFKGNLGPVLENHEFPCTDHTHNAFSLGPGGCAIETQAGDLQALIVEVERIQLQSLADICCEAWQVLAECASRGMPAPLFPMAVYLDLQMQTCLRQILDCTLPPSHRILYMEAKALELMALQAACGECAQRKMPRHSKTEYDRERILFAKEYLLKHMALPPTLTKLALVSGLNEFKLKNGFREMFGNSVFAYLAEHRLEMAKVALIEGSKTATEIAFDLGFSSLQHFSTRFKERFGVTPSTLRRPKSLDPQP